jgi:hypothetical protein
MLSHRLQEIEPIIEVQPPLKQREVGDHEFEESHLWFEECGIVEVEVESPPPIFNSLFLLILIPP